jgi:predicted dehydrogenase
VLEYAGSLIDEGSLGRIVQLRVDIAASLPNEDTRSAHRSWPGLITESAVHVFDLAARWLGPIEGVTADVDLPEKGRETGSGCIILHHAAAETVLQVVRMRRRAVSEQIVITGTAGTVHLVQTEPGSRPGSAPWRGTVRMNDAAAEEIAVSADAALMEFLRFNHPGHRMLSAFAEAVASDPCSREGISDSRRVLEILAAAWLSAPKSQRVLLPLSVGEDLQRHLALWS